MTDFPLPEKIKVTEEQDSRVTYEISPLYPGYGVTLGNALRRILLSSIEGSAITSLKIKGVNHEFSTIPGVLEDVITIILNLKKVRIKSFTAEPVALYLKVSGEKEVTAAEIKDNSQVQVINPEQLIATLTDKKADLEIEMVVEKGRGYLPVEQRQKEKISVGTIAIDAIFSPVKNVRMAVEDIRVGQRTDYNKLILEVETDGLLHPHLALQQALEILERHLETAREPLRELVAEVKDKEKETSSKKSVSGGKKTSKSKKKPKE